jgi:single-stranded DNA-binding protein
MDSTEKVLGKRMILTGEIYDHPEIRFTKEEVPVTRFAIVVHDIKRVPEYLQCVATHSLATTIGEYCKKGSRVAIEGHLREVPYKDGKAYKEIEVEKILFLDKMTKKRKIKTQTIDVIKDTDREKTTVITVKE